MTNEELIILYNDTKDEYVKDFFFEDNIRFAHSVAQRFIKDHKNSNDHDDIRSEALKGMVKAFNTFSPSKGCKFTTYADKVIANEILMYYRNIKKFNRFNARSIYEDTRTDENGKITLLDQLVSENVDMDTYLIVNERLELFNNNAREEDKEIYYLSFNRKLTQKEIASRVGLSQKTVCQRLKKIKARLVI